MQPDAAWNRRRSREGRPAEPLREVTQVARVARHAIKEIKYYQWERKDAENPIKEINESALDFSDRGHGRGDGSGR
jgi:hypothetical protein